MKVRIRGSTVGSVNPDVFSSKISNMPSDLLRNPITPWKDDKMTLSRRKIVVGVRKCPLDKCAHFLHYIFIICAFVNPKLFKRIQFMLTTTP